MTTSTRRLKPDSSISETAIGLVGMNKRRRKLQKKNFMSSSLIEETLKDLTTTTATTTTINRRYCQLESMNTLSRRQEGPDERLLNPAGCFGGWQVRGKKKSPEKEDNKMRLNSSMKGLHHHHHYHHHHNHNHPIASFNNPFHRWQAISISCKKSKQTTSRLTTPVAFHIAIIIACSLALIISSIPGNKLQVVAQRTSQQQQAPGSDVRSHQRLMQSANVELTRRSLQRAQRESPETASATNSAEILSTAPTTSSPAATCGYPGSPAHASVTFNTTHVVAGTAASYTCDNGYELLGPPKRICQLNGSWSPVGIPFCVLNVGLGKAAMQSSTAGHGSAQKAVDGSTSPYFQASTCTMTDVEHNPWWYVNLLEPYLVQIVRIDFGQACCANRQKATIAVRVGNNRPDLGNNPLCNRYHGFIEEGKPLFLPCTRPAPGAFVSIHLESPSDSSLSICETLIYTDHALSIEQCPSFRDQPLGSTATYNGKCYLFHNNQMLNFDSARKYCESRGGTLVDETSPALQGFLSWELYRRHRNDQLMGQYWLGAVRDPRQSTNWKWITGKDVQISFWNSLNTQGNCSRFDGSKGWLWSDTDCSAQLNFICQYRPLSCGKPEKPTNSTLLTKNIDNGTVIEYQCAPGNLLMGPKSRVCLPTGFFSEFAPKCKYLDCQFPAAIPNGDYRLLNSSTAYQSSVNYFCNDGFQLYGRSLLTCDVDERWNGPPPRCEPLLCPAPVAPSNGYVTVTSNITTPGTQATYDCRPGYELVGERLLACQSSGSWDNSFPYCREKRQSLAPHVLQLPGPSASPSIKPTPARMPSSSGATGQQSNVQFPPSVQPNSGGTGRPANSLQSQRTQPQATSSSSSSSSSTTTTTTPASLPASLNGLAGQFAPAITPVSTSTQSQSSSSGAQQVSPTLNEIPGGNQLDLSRRPSPGPSATRQQQQQASQVFINNNPGQAGSSSQAASSASPAITSAAASNRQQLTTVASVTTGSTNRAASQFQQFIGQPSSTATTLGSTTGSNQIQNQNQNQPDHSLATTNSISIHPNPSQATTSTASTTTNGILQSSSPILPMSTGNTQFQSGNVLASFANQQASNSIRTATPTAHNNHHHHHLSPLSASHNALANAKYSLDGIIAVAIFGGFIFLGAIITILVIIVRRKTSQSSSIDAQTISTYDSTAGGGENHNGLYRNYQQAWENLRFATPASQPKLSGTGAGSNGASLIGAHVSGGPSIGLKNYASPSVMLHHHHQHQHQQQQLITTTVGPSVGGHTNLGMTSSSGASSSAASSTSSSSLGANGVGSGSGGADPLLGPATAAHLHHHHHQQQLAAAAAHHHHHHHRHNHDEVVDEDEEDDEEQGVISADEANYAPRLFSAGHHLHNHHHNHHDHAPSDDAEGFRDTNELTINADTAAVPSNGQASAAARRRLYSAAPAVTSGTNSISRNSVNAANRRSLSNLNQQQQQQSSGHQHHHRHSHNHHHQIDDQQNQRLVVTSSTSASNSTRSSRASPPSDDQSLDRLAYGNNWRHNKQH